MWKLWDEDILYKTRDRGEAMLDDVRVVEEGRLTMELGVAMTYQNFGFPYSPSCSCCCVRAKGDGGRHERGAAKRR